MWKIHSLLLFYSIISTLLTCTLSSDGSSTRAGAGDAVRYTIPVTSNPRDARCIDGSPATYYLRPGNGNGKFKWLLFLEGGGWCWDALNCIGRSREDTGTSKFDSDLYPEHRMAQFMNIDPKRNPLLYNWNVVYIRYCDGSSFAGDAQINYKGTALHFNGKANRDAILRDLLLHHKMRRASTVLISGGSAGALSVFLGIDQMAEQIHSFNSNILVLGMPDSGFFMEFSSGEEKKMTRIGSYGAVVHGRLDYALGMRNVFTMTNMSAGANPSCLLAESTRVTHSVSFSSSSSNTVSRGRSNSSSSGSSSSISKDTVDEYIAGDTADVTSSEGLVLSPAAGAQCVFAAHLAPHIKTPMMVLQSQYDSWQLEYVAGSAPTVQQTNEFGRKLVRSLVQSLLLDGLPVGHGVFIDSCFRHTKHCKGGVDNFWSGPRMVSSIEHYSAATAMQAWITDIATAATTRVHAARTSLPRNTTVDVLRELQISSAMDDKHTVYAASRLTHFYFQKEDYPCAQCCACKSPGIY